MERCERDEHDSVPEVRHNLLGDPNGQPRLARPARSRESDHPRFAPAQQLGDRRDLAFAADEARSRHR
jgi:hypothetical protein